MDMHGELIIEHYLVIYMELKTLSRYNCVAATNCVSSRSVKQWDDHSLHHNY